MPLNSNWFKSFDNKTRYNWFKSFDNKTTLDHTMDILRLMDEGLTRDKIKEEYNFNPDLVSICFDSIRQNQWATEDSNHKFSITEKGRGVIEFYANRQLQERKDHSAETKK